MSLSRDAKDEIVRRFGRHEKDTGSPVVQFVLFSLELHEITKTHAGPNSVDQKQIQELTKKRISAYHYLHQHRPNELDQALNFLAGHDVKLQPSELSKGGNLAVPAGTLIPIRANLPPENFVHRPGLPQVFGLLSWINGPIAGIRILSNGSLRKVTSNAVQGTPGHFVVVEEILAATGEVSLTIKAAQLPKPELLALKKHIRKGWLCGYNKKKNLIYLAEGVDTPPQMGTPGFFFVTAPRNTLFEETIEIGTKVEYFRWDRHRGEFKGNTIVDAVRYKRPSIDEMKAYVSKRILNFYESRDGIKPLASTLFFKRDGLCGGPIYNFLQICEENIEDSNTFKYFLGLPSEMKLADIKTLSTIIMSGNKPHQSINTNTLQYLLRKYRFSLLTPILGYLRNLLRDVEVSFVNESMGQIADALEILVSRQLKPSVIDTLFGKATILNRKFQKIYDTENSSTSTLSTAGPLSLWVTGILTSELRNFDRRHQNIFAKTPDLTKKFVLLDSEARGLFARFLSRRLDPVLTTFLLESICSLWSASKELRVKISSPSILDRIEDNIFFILENPNRFGDPMDFIIEINGVHQLALLFPVRDILSIEEGNINLGPLFLQTDADVRIFDIPVKGNKKHIYPRGNYRKLFQAILFGENSPDILNRLSRDFAKSEEIPINADDIIACSNVIKENSRDSDGVNLLTEFTSIKDVDNHSLGDIASTLIDALMKNNETYIPAIHSVDKIVYLLRRIIPEGFPLEKVVRLTASIRENVVSKIINEMDCCIFNARPKSIDGGLCAMDEAMEFLFINVLSESGEKLSIAFLILIECVTNEGKNIILVDGLDGSESQLQALDIDWRITVAKALASYKETKAMELYYLFPATHSNYGLNSEFVSFLSGQFVRRRIRLMPLAGLGLISPHNALFISDWLLSTNWQAGNELMVDATEVQL